MIFFIALWPTVRLVLTRRWASPAFIVFLAMTIFSCLGLAASAAHIYAEPAESLIVPIPTPPPSPPGELAQVMTFESLCAGFVNASVFFLKPFGWVFIALFLVGIVKTLTDALPQKGRNP